MAIKNALKQLSPGSTQGGDEDEEPLNIEEIVNLITIRQYVVNSTANPALDRKAVNYMNGTLLMIDKKIMSLLESEKFKEYINYKDVRKAVEEVVKLNDIKSGIRHKL